MAKAQSVAVAHAEFVLTAPPVDTGGRSLFVSADMARRLGFAEAQIQSGLTVDGCYLADGSRLFIWDER